MSNPWMHPKDEALAALEWLGANVPHHGGWSGLAAVTHLPLSEGVDDCRAKLLVEGDSWFEYPTRQDLIEVLRSRRNLDIERIAHHGDTVQQMLDPQQNVQLYRKLRVGFYDMMLFSGGGNDILQSDVLRRIIKPRQPGSTPADLVDRAELARKLDAIQARYQAFLRTLPSLSRNPCLKIIAHTYDFVWPRNAPFQFLWIQSGPWIEPVMIERGIRDPEEKHAIVQFMLREFKKVLQDVAARSEGRLIVVDTQGTLSRNHWADEIHPSSEGAKLLADKIYQQGIRQLLPACAR